MLVGKASDSSVISLTPKRNLGSTQDYRVSIKTQNWSVYILLWNRLSSMSQVARLNYIYSHPGFGLVSSQVYIVYISIFHDLICLFCRY